MKILCLMPTYGRRRDLLNNSLACFIAQSHADKHLLIYDDLGTLASTECDAPNVTIISTDKRSASVGAKYNEMLAAFTGDYDAAAVWDDDDVYLPDHLTAHANCLESDWWSKPSQIISAYHQPPQIERGDGRFHGSLAIDRTGIETLTKRFGEPWIDTTRATFDQEFISRCQSELKGCDTCRFNPPQYIYRWQTTRSGHCSGLMGSDDWYARYQPDSREPISDLVPLFDDDTNRLYQMFASEGNQLVKPSTNR